LQSQTFPGHFLAPVNIKSAPNGRGTRESSRTASGRHGRPPFRAGGWQPFRQGQPKEGDSLPTGSRGFGPR
jgi:hypothetical protein